MSLEKTPISFQANCGYARFVMRQLELTETDREAKVRKFKHQFEQTLTYGLRESYFTRQSSRPSLFERHSSKMREAWSNRWYPLGTRSAYEETFSVEKWNGLPLEEQRTHTLGNCKACYEKHQDLQTAFPLTPCYKFEPVVTVNKEVLTSLGRAEGTKTALKVLNTAFTDTFEDTFVSTMIKHGRQGVQVCVLVNRGYRMVATVQTVSIIQHSALKG